MAAKAVPAPVVSSGHSNEVRLLGRLAAAPVERELPSGDVIVTFRLVVDRDRPARQRGPQVDTIDCTAWRADVRRAVSRYAVGDLVDLSGALRRRFWRGVGGAVSRCEVEVRSARRARTPA